MGCGDIDRAEPRIVINLSHWYAQLNHEGQPKALHDITRASSVANTHGILTYADNVIYGGAARHPWLALRGSLLAPQNGELAQGLRHVNSPIHHRGWCGRGVVRMYGRVCVNVP